MIESFQLVIFFVVAVFYSSIGFGGGSSYLAILSLLLIDFYEIRSMALVLNLVVVSIGISRFVKNQLFDWKKFFPFLLLSLPLVIVATQIRLSEIIFFILLGISLILAAIFIFTQLVRTTTKGVYLSKLHCVLLGGCIGFLSGLVGIGGGIFLSPSLNILKWENAKVVASLASLYIFSNSIIGILGLFVAGSFRFNLEVAPSVVVVIAIGALIGSYLSVNINFSQIKILTALLILYVGLKLVLLHGFEIQI